MNPQSLSLVGQLNVAFYTIVFFQGKFMNSKQPEADNIITIDIVGKAGSGKTTLLPYILKELQQAAPSNISCTRPKKITIYEALVIMFNKPVLFKQALSLTYWQKSKNNRLLIFTCWVARLSKHYRCQVLFNSQEDNDGAVLLLHDQGLVHFLRKTNSPLPMSFLRKLPLPNFVINIEADRYTIFKRTVLRSKPIKKTQVLFGKNRFHKAKLIINKYKGLVSDQELQETLKLWSDKFCDPPLSETSLNKMVFQPDTIKLKNNNYLRREQVEGVLRSNLKTLGVNWIDIKNNETCSLAKASKTAARQIWEKLMGTY